MVKRFSSLFILVAFAASVVGCSGSSTPGSSSIPQQQTTQGTTTHTQAITPHASTNPTKNIPITGTATNAAFSGTFSINRFIKQGKKLFAVGTLSGTLTNTTSSAVIGNVSQIATLPVAVADPSCPILSLTLGPLDLNLLGLMVHLNQVVLTITAQSAPGNLLGNLLCAIANLLNGGAPLSSIANLLNQILAILQGL